MADQPSQSALSTTLSHLPPLPWLCLLALFTVGTSHSAQANPLNDSGVLIESIALHHSGAIERWFVIIAAPSPFTSRHNALVAIWDEDGRSILDPVQLDSIDFMCLPESAADHGHSTCWLDSRETNGPVTLLVISVFPTALPEDFAPHSTPTTVIPPH